MNAKIYKNVKMADCDDEYRDIKLNNLNWLNRFVVLKTTDEYGDEYMAYEKTDYEDSHKNIVEMFEWCVPYATGVDYGAMRDDVDEMDNKY